MREVRNIPKIFISAALDFHTIYQKRQHQPSKARVGHVAESRSDRQKTKAACSSKLRLKVWAALLSFHLKKNKEVKLPSVHHSGTGTRFLQLHRPKETRHTRSSSGRQATVDFPSFIVTSSHQIRSEKATKTHTKAARLQKNKKKKPGRLLYVSGEVKK